MSNVDYKVLVGLEIHVQLNTRTKMFCGCELVFGAEPNSRVCPVCLGMPGSLPVMNKKAVEFSILAGLALNCEIAVFTKWDRKSYYYPDLPKNYQISQYDLPLALNGYIEIPAKDGTFKKIRIRRAHLEEDAGKNLHTAGNFSQVDLNRAGTPLLEIVTEPDMNTAAEVRALAEELQRIVRYLDVSEADMQKGHMRFEPNVNLVITRSGQQFKTPIVEVKNLNSFKALENSIDYEINRQLDRFLETGETMEMGNKSTRGWDDAKEVTVLQREKEEAHDYRYFPDPDLVPVRVNEQWLNEIKAGRRELPLKRRLRYVKEYGLSDYDAGVLTEERATADFFEEAVKKHNGDAKIICNFITQTGLKIANEKRCKVSELGVSTLQLSVLAEMVKQGLISEPKNVTAATAAVFEKMGRKYPAISASASVTVFKEIVNSGKEPEIIAKELNLIQKSDAGELGGIVDDVIKNNPQAVADVKEGGKKSGKARGFLLGQVMQKSKGTANPKIAGEILDKKLSQ